VAPALDQGAEHESENEPHLRKLASFQAIVVA
jgi:hypothetical protein